MKTTILRQSGTRLRKAYVALGMRDTCGSSTHASDATVVPVCYALLVKNISHIIINRCDVAWSRAASTILVDIVARRLGEEFRPNFDLCGRP